MSKPTIQEAIALLRQISPDHGEAVAGHIFKDTKIPTMGNEFAYNDFLSRHKDRGYHVSADLTDFSRHQ